MDRLLNELGRVEGNIGDERRRKLARQHRHFVAHLGRHVERIGAGRLVDRKTRRRLAVEREHLPVGLRSELHARGLRYRLHKRLLNGLRREADLVFGPARVAVFVDGCFWHGCPEHATWPKRNGIGVSSPRS